MSDKMLEANLYAKFDYVLAIEGPYEEELPNILSGEATLETSDARFEMPELEPLTDWQGRLALIAPREGGRVFTFDGLGHLERPKTGIYIEAGEITGDEIERIRAGEGPLQVDFFGTTEIKAESAFRCTQGRCQPDMCGCILVRPDTNLSKDAPFPAYHRIVIGLANSEPTVVTPADLRNALRWRFETEAARVGKSIPYDALDSMVNEAKLRVEQSSYKMTLDKDDPLLHEVRNIARRQRNLGLIGRNDNCPCGSGKKFKKCCYNKN
jgi:SEC-C motif